MTVNNDPNKIVFIKLRSVTREALKREGYKGETYDTIINRLMGERKQNAR